MAVLGGLIVLVGPSRMYLGHHWLSDVIGGYALGGAALLLVIAAYQAQVRKAAEREAILDNPEDRLERGDGCCEYEVHVGGRSLLVVLDELQDPPALVTAHTLPRR